MTITEKIKLRDSMFNAIRQLSDLYDFIEKYEDDSELNVELRPLVISRCETIVNNYTKLKEEWAL